MANAWISHLKQFWSQNKGKMSYKQAMKEAKKTYTKVDGKSKPKKGKKDDIMERKLERDAIIQEGLKKREKKGGMKKILKEAGLSDADINKAIALRQVEKMMGGALPPKVSTKDTRSQIVRKYTAIKKAVQDALNKGQLPQKSFNDFMRLSKFLAGNSKSNKYAKDAKKIEKSFNSKKYIKAKAGKEARNPLAKAAQNQLKNLERLVERNVLVKEGVEKRVKKQIDLASRKDKFIKTQLTLGKTVVEANKNWELIKDKEEKNIIETRRVLDALDKDKKGKKTKGKKTEGLSMIVSEVKGDRKYYQADGTTLKVSVKNQAQKIMNLINDGIGETQDKINAFFLNRRGIGIGTNAAYPLTKAQKDSLIEKIKDYPNDVFKAFTSNTTNISKLKGLVTNLPEEIKKNKDRISVGLSAQQVVGQAALATGQAAIESRVGAVEAAVKTLPFTGSRPRPKLTSSAVSPAAPPGMPHNNGGKRLGGLRSPKQSIQMIIDKLTAKTYTYGDAFKDKIMTNGGQSPSSIVDVNDATAILTNLHDSHYRNAFSGLVDTGLVQNRQKIELGVRRLLQEQGDDPAIDQRIADEKEAVKTSLVDVDADNLSSHLTPDPRQFSPNEAAKLNPQPVDREAEFDAIFKPYMTGILLHQTQVQMIDVKTGAGFADLFGGALRINTSDLSNADRKKVIVGIKAMIMGQLASDKSDVADGLVSRDFLYSNSLGLIDEILTRGDVTVGGSGLGGGVAGTEYKVDDLATRKVLHKFKVELHKKVDEYNKKIAPDEQEKSKLPEPTTALPKIKPPIASKPIVPKPKVKPPSPPPSPPTPPPRPPSPRVSPPPPPTASIIKGMSLSTLPTATSGQATPPAKRKLPVVAKQTPSSIVPTPVGNKIPQTDAVAQAIIDYNKDFKEFIMEEVYGKSPASPSNALGDTIIPLMKQMGLSFDPNAFQGITSEERKTIANIFNKRNTYVDSGGTRYIQSISEDFIQKVSNAYSKGGLSDINDFVGLMAAEFLSPIIGVLENDMKADYLKQMPVTSIQRTGAGFEELDDTLGGKDFDHSTSKNSDSLATRFTILGGAINIKPKILKKDVGNQINDLKQQIVNLKVLANRNDKDYSTRRDDAFKDVAKLSKEIINSPRSFRNHFIQAKEQLKYIDNNRGRIGGAILGGVPTPTSGMTNADYKLHFSKFGYHPNTKMF